MSEPEHTSEASRARWLLTPEAVRSRCGRILRRAEEGALPHFSLNRDRLDPCAAYVADTIRQNYPDLEIPFHARWRHFVVRGNDRWAAMADREAWERKERARIAFDLAITSVLLDAGSGPHWSYKDRSGQVLARSEGLAIASLDAFERGLFSGSPANPFRADAQVLSTLRTDDLASAFQLSAENRLAGLEGRADLMRSLGRALQSRPDLFGGSGRIGNLADVLLQLGPAIEARDILIKVLDGLGSIWPGRSELAGQNLGDCWRHSGISAEDGLVPFHKLSQWLSYSLIEPLQDAGIEVRNIDGLTGLAEYRNGGLLIDLGVLSLKDPEMQECAHAPGDELIVEWRALTIALLDELAERVRGLLGLSSEHFPLAKVLEGGTWAAGRRIAAEKRPSGGPPLTIQSDGSVF
ncbi:MAG: URC4/urg3 family protein [Pseudomonadota bacterium]